MAAHLGFAILSIALLLFFLFSGRKEIPLLLICHALLQYSLTMVLWFFKLSGGLSSILMFFLCISSVLLIWGRSLSYGKNLFSIRLFFSVSQWTILLLIFIFIFLKSPFYYVFPAAELNENLPMQRLTFHPILKLSGNILIFTSFFQVVLHWGQRWKLVKSMIDLLPVIIYVVLLIVLREIKLESLEFPFS